MTAGKPYTQISLTKRDASKPYGVDLFTKEYPETWLKMSEINRILRDNGYTGTRVRVKDLNFSWMSEESEGSQVVDVIRVDKMCE